MCLCFECLVIRGLSILIGQLVDMHSTCYIAWLKDSMAFRCSKRTVIFSPNKEEEAALAKAEGKV